MKFYVVKDFKVIYCAVCKKDPTKRLKKICKPCTIKEIAVSIEETTKDINHRFQ